MQIITWLVAGRIRLRRIAHEGWPLTDADWQEILTRLRQEAGVTRYVRLLSSSVVSTPITWGSFSPAKQSMSKRFLRIDRRSRSIQSYPVST